MNPTINKRTRVTRHTDTATDHIFTNTIMGNMEIKTANCENRYFRPFYYYLCNKEQNRGSKFIVEHFQM